jgi:hypothetical protein
MILMRQYFPFNWLIPSIEIGVLCVRCTGALSAADVAGRGAGAVQAPELA